MFSPTALTPKSGQHENPSRQEEEQQLHIARTCIIVKFPGVIEVSSKRAMLYMTPLRRADYLPVLLLRYSVAHGKETTSLFVEFKQDINAPILLVLASVTLHASRTLQLAYTYSEVLGTCIV